MRKKFITPLLLLLTLTLPLLLSFSCQLNPDGNSDGNSGGNQGGAGSTSFSNSSICVASWNVQNLFDDIDNGTEYSEYLSSSGWNTKGYNLRLSNTAQVLDYLPKAKDYIIILNEIENTNVIEGLLSQKKLRSKKLAWYAFASAYSGSIGTAVLSSLEIVSAKVHKTDDSLRPILEVEFNTNGGKLYILSLHFKSNVGGETETAPMRLKAAKVVAQVAAQLKKENPGCLILTCGDFNEECWADNTMTRLPTVSAPLKVSGTFSNGTWYCPWLDTSQNLWPNGSYYYNEHWKCYDNILISQEGRDGTGLEYIKAGVIFQGILRTSDDKPNAWQLNLLKGVSDHLPVWIVLEY